MPVPREAISQKNFTEHCPPQNAIEIALRGMGVPGVSLIWSRTDTGEAKLQPFKAFSLDTEGHLCL
jgi:hypothetical protein